MPYSGFSTKNKKAINNVLTGNDLVIEDLMNEIMTRKGERIMLPTFGSIIHDMVFEPLTDETRTIIEEDLTAIIEGEPRVNLVDLNLSDDNHSVTVRIRINILPSEEVTELVIDLERE